MSKPSSSRLTPSAQSLPPPPKLTPDLETLGACTFGHYPWDEWERYARAQGLEAELAILGRLLIREAFNHAWAFWLQNLCGWGDDGQALLASALRAPKTARRHWEILMRTDGLRGDFPPRSTDWRWGFLRADAQRLLHQLTSQERNHGPHSR